MSPSPNISPQLLQQANFVLNACARPVPPGGTSWVDIPSHVGYSRFMPGGGTGTEDIGGVLTKLPYPFYLRALTAQALPRQVQGVYWRARFGNGKYFQSELTPHAMAFGFGSNRQVFTNEVLWQPGEKVYVDLDTKTAGPPPTDGYTVQMMFEGVYRFPIQGGPPTNVLNQDIPRYYLKDNQNILAPEFRFAPSCPSETPDGYQDEEYPYVSPVVNLNVNGTPVSQIRTAIQADSDFIVRQIWPYFPNPGEITNLPQQGSGSVVIRLRRGDGYSMMSNFIPINAIQGPIFKELRVKAGDNLYHDAYVVDGGGPGAVLSFGLYFYGVKRRRVL